MCPIKAAYLDLQVVKQLQEKWYLESTGHQKKIPGNGPMLLSVKAQKDVYAGGRSIIRKSNF